jgi:hypothetical protein
MCGVQYLVITRDSTPYPEEEVLKRGDSRGTPPFGPPKRGDSGGPPPFGALQNDLIPEETS